MLVDRGKSKIKGIMLCNCTIKNGQIAIAKENKGSYNSHKIQESKGAYPYRICPFDVLSEERHRIILR